MPASARIEHASLRHRQVQVGEVSLHVGEAGDPAAPATLLLHGWPQSAACWEPLMTLAAPQAHTVAIDLPGIGGSTGTAADGSKRHLAQVVHELIAVLRLHDVTLVGHDAGGMIAYAYLRAFDDVARVVILNTVVPGVDPWDDVLRNPYIWHFAFHAIPGLPEQLVQGHQAAYFDYFFDVLTPDPSKITAGSRAASVSAYATDAALSAGFGWYRALTSDAADNRQSVAAPAARTPLLYLRGQHEGGDLAAYVKGLQDAGVSDVQAAIVPGAGHFTPDEAPDALWRLISGDAVAAAG
jgi:pimeloyl-ACP methyl ester carboxylesterase